MQQLLQAPENYLFGGWMITVSLALAAKISQQYRQLFQELLFKEVLERRNLPQEAITALHLKQTVLRGHGEAI